jgi:hypothetical protein
MYQNVKFGIFLEEFGIANSGMYICVHISRPFVIFIAICYFYCNLLFLLPFVIFIAICYFYCHLLLSVPFWCTLLPFGILGGNFGIFFPFWFVVPR